MNTYELDWEGVRWSNIQYSNTRLVKILTGLSYEEIKTAAPDKEAWNGQDFIKTFYKLGFNTSERFIKFDPATDKPCIMRTTWYTKKNWGAFIYNNGLVNNYYTLDMWKDAFPEIRITSMLQVWI
jgi:hypothetical protein